MMPSLLTMLQSCQSKPRLEWEPLFFSEEEARFMASLVDTILPRTDTPGALDVKVDIFMDTVFAKSYDAEGQQKIRSEIAQFNENCKKDYGAVFVDLDQKDKEAVLKAAEANAGKFSGSVWGTAVGPQEAIGFYRSIKSMAIWAYTTSEEIGRNVLSYDPVPQEYKGCIPLSDVGNRWTL